MIKPRTTASILLGAAVFVGLYLTSLYNYLLFHSLAEMFSIVIAACIFIIAWHSGDYLENNYLLFLGPVYLCVGGLDLLHTISYKGMGVMPEYGPNLPTQLWIAARYMESVALLAAPFASGRKLRVEWILAGCGLFTALLIVSILVWDAFPDCFLPGTGLTLFKKISEYVICILMAGALARLWRNRERFDPVVFRLIGASMILTIFGELSFTAYVSVYGSFNLLGHLFKMASFYLIYKAVVETGFETPHLILYNDLARSRERLEWEAAMDAALAELAGKIIVQTSIDEVSRLVTHHGKKLTNSQWGCAAYIDIETGQEAVGAQIGDPPENACRISGPSPDDDSNDPRLSAESVIDGEIVGRIELSGGPGTYRDQDRKLIRQLADLYALAIQRRRREAEEKRRMAKDLGTMRTFTNGSDSSVSRHYMEQGPLREIVPDRFEDLVQEHGSILDELLESKAYKVDRGVKKRLREMGDCLGFLKAAPRDVIDIHITSLERKSQGASHKKNMAYADEGRLMALELMGYLAAHYRRQN